MTAPGEALAAAAERLLGTPFRLHGRDPAFGLDCIGLVSTALAAIGQPASVPPGYRLRQLDIAQWLAAAEQAGLRPASGRPLPGDIVSVRPGPAQHHLLVAGPAASFIHAHAGLGRVVATPAPLPWPIDRQWRLSCEQVFPWQLSS